MPETNSLRTRGSRIAAGIVLACYWLIMFAGTHWPHVSLESYPQNTDKLLHFTGYAGFGFLIAIWMLTKRTFGPRDCAIAFCIIFIYAIVDEVTQPWFGRDCEFLDMVADWCGGLAGLAFFLLVGALRRRFVRSKS
jgi:VanZ family protein